MSGVLRAWSPRIGRVGLFLIPLFVILFIWLPELRHYYVTGIDDEKLSFKTLRQLPDETTWQRVANVSYLPVAWRGDNELLAIVNRLLQDGRLQLDGYPEMSLSLPFREEDLERGQPSWQLMFASLLIPDMFLRAYELTGQERFFDAARQSILAWARYERAAWLPQGFLWNDHAVAARIPVLARFWRHYRRHREYRQDEAALVLGFVARSGQLLAKPAHYNYATNHGVMQNLGLLHLAVAFPGLTEVAAFKRIAVERLTRQMTYYINDEGIVLEHSAGYHRDGVKFLDLALRYTSMLNIPVPPEWSTKYRRAKLFYTQLRRPDGTLPMFGDTGSDPGAESNEVTVRPGSARTVYPVAGYSVWWDGLEHWPQTEQLAQTVVPWSNFPGHGHKSADELSVLFWAAGHNWWSNVGYWPYGVDGRERSRSWSGSNAPHLVDEPRQSERTVRRRYTGWNDDLALIDLERTGPKAYRVRRQVLNIGGRAWVVIDSASDPSEQSTRSIWRTHPDTRLLRGATPGEYLLMNARHSARLNAYFVGAGPLTVTEHRGVDPAIAGWVASNHVPVATSSIVVDQPSNGAWMLTAWSFATKNAVLSLTGRPTMDGWRDSEHWSLTLSLNGQAVRLERQGAEIRVHGGNKSARLLRLQAGANEGPPRETIRLAYAQIQASYGKYADLGDYRAKVSKYLLGLFMLQEFMLLLYGRFVRATSGVLRVAIGMGWLAAGYWLVNVYLVA